MVFDASTACSIKAFEVASVVGLSKPAACVGVGHNITDAVVVLRSGTHALNRLGKNLTVAVEPVPVSTVVSDCCTVDNAVDSCVGARNKGEHGKVCGSPGCMSGSTGSGGTGLVTALWV